MEQTSWSETVILVDADYLDRVAFDLIVNFERMIDRRIPAGDLCHWLDCIALDGGLRPGDNAVQAVFLHSKEKQRLDYMTPGDFATDLNGKAFRDTLGEFGLLSYPVEDVISAADFFIQSAEALIETKGVNRLLLIGDMEEYGNRIKSLCAKAEGADITIFTMEPTPGRGFSQEILGYSLMSALGIRGDEIK